MTTVEMKLALLKHFRYVNYPMVATECDMSPSNSRYACRSFTADILAIKKDIMVEIEIKQYPWEITKDLKTKRQKHAFYLRTKSPWDNSYDFWERGMIRPHKFYFACPVTLENRKSHSATCLSNMPVPYGLILMYGIKNCWVQKRAKWLHRDLTHLEDAKERMFLRLVRENIYLREKEYDRKNEKSSYQKGEINVTNPEIS